MSARSAAGQNVIKMSNFLFIGDCLAVLKTLPDESVHCCVTSPPYFGLRDYQTATWEGGDPTCDHVANPNATKKFGNPVFNENRPSREETKTGGYYKDVCPKCGAIRKDDQIGLEETPEEYVEKLVEVFREVRRVLRPDGTCWIVIGDSYNGSGGNHKQHHKNDTGFQGQIGAENYKGKGNRIDSLKSKDLIGIPWRLAFALQLDGWYLRQDIIWSKNNPLPESVKDRCTKAHEYVFLLSKSSKYYFDNTAIKEPAAYDGRKDTRMKGSAKYKTSAVPDKKEHTMAAQGSERWQRGENGEYLRNKRSVWSVNTKPYKAAHFACIDEQTDVLTLNGWKNIESISIEDNIATLDILDEEIHYHKPYGIHVYDYDGELIHIKNQWIDQLVTPNHRVLLKYVHNTSNCKKHFDENWHYINAEDITMHSGILIPNAGKYKGFLSIGEDKAALLGWIITEGHITQSGSIQIYQSLSANPHKVATIEELLIKCGILYSKSERTRITPNNKESIEVVFRLNKSQNDLTWVYAYINKDKTPKWNLLHLKENELNALYKALIDGDGHRRVSDGRESFIQKDPYVQSWFRVLCCHLNMRTTLNEKRTRISSCMTSHVTQSNYSQIHQSDFKECVTREHYKGKVWCPHLPNTNFIAKRGNCIFITGNTFPPKLIEPCILAGTSEKGVCPDCGSPWKRVEEVTRINPINRQDLVMATGGAITGGVGKNFPESTSKTTGWQPTCTCEAGDPVPATVLDPFAGSGTVGEVCDQLGRSAILIELNPDYAPLIEMRAKCKPLSW